VVVVIANMVLIIKPINSLGWAGLCF